VPELSTQDPEKICAHLAPHASGRNPVDLTFHIDMKAITEEIPRMLFESDEVDGIIIHGIMDTGFMELLHPGVTRFVNVPKEELLSMAKVTLDPLMEMPNRYAKPLLISSFSARMRTTASRHSMQALPPRSMHPRKQPKPWGYRKLMTSAFKDTAGVFI
jgi:acetyltransferase